MDPRPWAGQFKVALILGASGRRMEYARYSFDGKILYGILMPICLEEAHVAVTAAVVLCGSRGMCT